MATKLRSITAPFPRFGFGRRGGGGYCSSVNEEFGQSLPSTLFLLSQKISVERYDIDSNLSGKPSLAPLRFPEENLCLLANIHSKILVYSLHKNKPKKQMGDLPDFSAYAKNLEKR